MATYFLLHHIIITGFNCFKNKLVPVNRLKDIIFDECIFNIISYNYIASAFTKEIIWSGRKYRKKDALLTKKINTDKKRVV